MDRRKKYRCIPVFVIMILILAESIAAVNTVSAHNFDMGYVPVVYDEKNGAYTSNVNDILQASDGTIYIAGSVGLISYNGREFTRECNGLTSEVNVLMSDSLGNIWVGTNDAGLMIMNGDEISTYDKKSELDSNSIHAIMADNRAGVYVATSSGLYHVDRRMTFERVEADACSYTVSMACNDNGIIAGISNSGEVYFIDGGVVRSGYAKMISQDTCTNVGVSGSAFLFSTYEGEIITVVYEDGKIQKTSRTIEDLSGINSFYMEDDRCFVLADSGIGYLRDDTFTYINLDDFAGYYQDMLCDFEGNYWIASSRYGLLQLAQDDFKYVSNVAQSTAGVVNTTLEYRGNVYVGKDDGLCILNRYTYEETSNELTALLDGVKVNCIIDDNHGSLWIATYGSSYGLIRYRAGEIQNFNQTNGMPSDSISFVKNINDDMVAAVTRNCITFIENGVIKQIYNKDGSQFQADVLDIIQDEQGNLLIATDGEGIIIWKDGSIIRHITTEDGLSSDVVRKFVTYEDGYLLVTGNALCYMQDNEVQRLDFSYSGMFDIVKGLGDQLWLLSNSGLFCINGSELMSGENVEYELYNYDNGFQASLTSKSWCDTDDNGEVYLCCQDGLVVFSLVDTAARKIDYQIGIKGVYADSTSLEHKNGVELPMTFDRLIIKPAFTKFGYEKLTISYYLEGYDNVVTVVDSSELPDEITYSNLPGGEYTFHMDLLRNNGREVIDSVDLKINKKMVWYERDAVKLLITLLAVLILFLGGHIFIRVQLANAEKKKNAYRNITKQTIMAIAKTIDAKDEYTNGHSLRVANYSMEIAKRYGMKPEQQEDIYYCGLLHDIGKIGIPDEILNKTSRLTDEEYAIIKSHPTKGAEILSDITTIPHIVEGAKYHHEKFDGSGYNEGLIGTQIPLFARIIAVADTFDAMTSSRCYRTGLDIEYVKSELKRVAGKQLDPTFVNIILGMINDGTINLEQIS
jgi:energy-coupling factor transport system substrate-specific component